MDEEATSAVMTLMLTVGGLSLAALAYLFQKHIGGQSLLTYQPRRRVPWGPLAVFMAMVMPLFGVASFFIGSDLLPAEDVSIESLLITGWGNFTFMVLFVVGGLAGLVLLCRADVHDLGLPTSWKQFTQDIGLGLFATIAAVLPIYAIQLTLLAALQSETQHPLVKQLEAHQTPAMLLLGFAMAVIAAPLFEEFTFRSLLQGWLEKREDETLGFIATEREPVIDVLPAQLELDLPYTGLPGVGLPAATDIAATGATPTGTPARPPHGWITDLPHGWTPILISGGAFGLAHIGHGVAPVPLVLFGIVLGYLYQRTHRLVPSITAHMVFNAYSMVLLWLQLRAPLAD